MFEFRIIVKCDVCGKILSEDACDIDDFYSEPETVEFYYEDGKVYVDDDEVKHYFNIVGSDEVFDIFWHIDKGVKALCSSHKKEIKKYFDEYIED